MTTYPVRRGQRLKGFDYSTSGFYAITVCVQDRLPLFGHVEHAVMHRSEAGIAIDRNWQELATRFPGVSSDVVMVMPDHLHGILALDGQTPTLSHLLDWFKGQSTARYARGVRDAGWRRFSGQLWQRGYYDRIIRKDEDLEAIRAYIVSNPERWEVRSQ